LQWLCYGGMLTESTFMSFIKWANTARQLGIDWTLETMVNESLISRARNTLTAKFLDMVLTQVIYSLLMLILVGLAFISSFES